MISIIRTVVLNFILLGQTWTAENQHKINILEDGMIIQQTVTEYDDLQVYEMPQHGDRLHIVAYLDFQSGLQLIKDVKNERCQLSNMEQQQMLMRHVKLTWPQSNSDGFVLPDLPVNSDAVNKVNILKLEELQPMSNTSYLRFELQQACAGLPIYWADSVNEDDLNRMTNSGVLEYDRDAKMVLRAMHPEQRGSNSQSDSCNPTNIPSNQFECQGSCVFQKCRMTSHSCYYFVMCPMNGMVGQSCLSHALHMGGQCKMCCRDPKSPCQLTSSQAYWIHCDCLTW